MQDASQNDRGKLGDPVSGRPLTPKGSSFHGQVRILEGQKLPPRLSVFLIPAEPESSNDVLRFFAAPAADGTFAINNLPPGRYWAIARPAEDSESDLQSKLRLPDEAEARAKLRQEVEATKTAIELKPCQNVTNYSLPRVVP